MNRTENASRNIIWGIINKIIMLGMPFATRTVLIYTLGMEYVGLGSLFTSIIQVLSFAELGIGTAIVFSMYEPIAKGDTQKICALLAFYKNAYRIIGFIIIVIGLTMMPFIKYLIAGDLPKGINLYILYCIYLLNNVIGYFLYAYKQVLFTASQRIDIISKINMLVMLASGLLQILILLFAKNYYAFAILIPVTTFLNNILIGYLSNKHFSYYQSQGKLEKKELDVIKKKIGGMVFQKIGTIVLTSVDTIVISAFLGLTQLGIYQNYYYIITAIFGLLVVVTQSITSVIGNSIVTESIHKNFVDFRKFNFIYIWIVTFCSACLLCLYQPFMKLWVGEKNMLSFGMVLLFSIYFYVHKWCDMLAVYQEATGIWWETRFIPLFAALINLSLNIILVQLIGMPGILISTIVAVILVYDPGFSSVIFKTYFKTIDSGFQKYWRKQIVYIFVAIIACLTCWGCCRIVMVNSTIITILINLVICIIVPNIVFALCMHKTSEYKEAKKLLYIIIHRKWRK